MGHQRFLFLCLFLMVILTYGMETTFFRFSEAKSGKTGYSARPCFCWPYFHCFLFFRMRLQEPWRPGCNIVHPEYVIWFAWILGLDALSSIPFARLRHRIKPSGLPRSNSSTSLPTSAHAVLPATLSVCTPHHQV